MHCNFIYVYTNSHIILKHGSSDIYFLSLTGSNSPYTVNIVASRLAG